MARNRRDFIKKSGFIGLGFIGLKLYACGNAPSIAESGAAAAPLDYGPLITDPKGMLDLPKGFSYKVISKQGDPMDDGLVVPGKQDGMATFPTEDGKVIIVRNHEIVAPDKGVGAFGLENENIQTIPESDFYEYGKGEFPGLGGTTTLVFNEKTMEVEKEFLSLAGTYRNCAGGAMPWGSWVSCEEDVTKAGDYEGNVTKDHGYVFEVPATTEIMRAAPKPIKEMGRFNHEAVAYDPNAGIVYLTEDRGDGLLYRFIPNKKDDIHSGGKLQALMIKGQPKFDTRNWPDSPTKIAMGELVNVEWVDLENVESPEDDLRMRGHEKGAAIFARGEGMWYDNGTIFFACTNGGAIMKGQVFKLTPDAKNAAGGTLELFIETDNVDIMKYCDNLTITPWGDVMLCEDDLDAYLRGVTPEGHIFTFGHSTKHQSEFTGICFSPSGKTMFVNIQHAGLTLAITGPWKKA